MGKIIQIKDLNKNFGAERALIDVSLDLYRGQSVAVMGPSGSGKSTLLNCVSGVLAADSGSVIFEDHDIQKLSDKARSKLRLEKFGFIFQDCQLIPELQARENVALPLQLTGISRYKALNQADEFLERLGIGQQAHKLPGNMSGGQAQRVAIARALVSKPTVLFADEPTGALDQSTGQEVMQLLSTLIDSEKITLVLVTHDSSVASWCERLVEFRDARVHADQLIRS